MSIHHLIINTLLVKQTYKPCILSESDDVTEEEVNGQTQVEQRRKEKLRHGNRAKLNART